MTVPMNISSDVELSDREPGIFFALQVFILSNFGGGGPEKILIYLFFNK